MSKLSPGTLILGIFAVLFGLSVSSVSVVMAGFSVEICGRRNLGVIMGTLDVAFSIGSAVGPFIGGFVYDTYGSYSLAFLLAAAFNLVTALLVGLIRPRKEIEGGISHP